MSLDARFARLVAARLCHDLGGAIATLVGTLDLVGVVNGAPGDDASGDEMLALSKDTALALRRRLKLYAAAWTGPNTEADATMVAGLLAGAPAADRVVFDCDGLAPGTMLPAGIVPLALNAALLAAEALPRGGIVHLSGSAEAGLVAWPEGRNAAWPPPVLALLSGTAPELLLEAGPRFVLAPLLGVLVAEAGWRLSLCLAGGDVAPSLLLAPAD